MRNRQRNSIRIEGLTLDLTSSLNQFFLCECNRKFESKQLLIKHIGDCNGVPVTHFCHWCNIPFKNRGNLVLHAKFIHGDLSYQESKLKKFECNACSAKYDALWKLKYHIRGTHFNLLASASHFETKQVNQVWFEKVLNSKNLVKITKTGPNTLVMKAIAPDSVTISDHNQPDKIDLHSVYPTGRKKIRDVICNICKRNYRNRDLKKHIQEAHQKDFSKHKCNNCDMTFKRSYIFLKHVCNKPDGRYRRKTVKGVTPCGKGGIKITNVLSLLPVEID